MQHYIRSITISLLERVSGDQLHYTPAELSESGYPEFVVNRIRLELQRNLAESVTLPESDWADMQADPVQDAWDRFLEAINAETRIPESYLRSVTENAVEDILEQLAEPEKFVLDTLFRHEREVSVLEMHARREWIVLNGHLADAVLRFMQRRDLKTITRDRAAGIIRQIDQHLASGYTPLKWAQALDICFKLMGSQVPSTLFSRYFADKGLDDVAERMLRADEELTRSRLIELLSSPGLDWRRKDTSAVEKPAGEAEQKATDTVQADTAPENTPEPANTDICHDDDRATAFDEAMQEDSASAETGTSDDEVIPELNQSDGDEEELPIWMRFLDADAGDDETDQTHPPSEAIPDHGQTPDDSFEEPLIQRFQQEESEEESWEPEENPDTSSRNLLTDASKELLDRMGAHADLFLQDFFNNELDDFYTSLNALTSFHTWQEAGTYLTREIFIPREIDIYSGEAVLFVDLLQQYFEETS